VVRSRPLALVVVVAAVLLGACRVDSTVSVRVDEDGSGAIRVRVALDADAVAAVEAGGEPLEANVRLDDLGGAGWQVSPWVRRGGGRAVLEIRRPFDSPESFERVLADLNGADGPLRAVRLRRSSGAVRTTYEFHAVGDIGAATAGVTDDDELIANLTAQRVDVGPFETSLTEQVREALHLRVEVSLPGAGTRTWTIPPDSRRALSTSSTTFELGRAVLLVIGVLAVGAALVLVFAGEWRARRRRRVPSAR